MLTHLIRPFTQLACILMAVPAFAQAPAPSTVRVISSNKDSIEVEVSDPDGIAWVDVEYGVLPRIRTERKSVAGCPKTLRITFPRTRRFLLRREPFYGLYAVDCSSDSKGEFVVTHLRQDASGAFKVFHPAHKRSWSLQRLLDRFTYETTRTEIQELVAKIILALIVITLAIAIAIWWTTRKALGPFLQSRTE